MKTTHTPEEIAAAMRIFIASGSANGNEAMRRECLRLVPLFSAADALRAALEDAVNALDESAMSGLPNLRGATAEMRAVLAKAKVEA